jgi:GTP cyclohydrolase I
LTKRQVDRARAAQAVAAFLDALGHDLSGELAGTPERVVAAWADELLAGYDADGEQILREGAIDLGEGPHGIVVLRDIAVSVVCPHHLLPSHGFASIAYAPKRHAAGLGAIAAAVHALAQRLVLQEPLGNQITETISRALDAEGALARLDLTHTCFVARGEKQAASTLTTLAFSGSFRGADRDAALAALQRRDADPNDKGAPT